MTTDAARRIAMAEQVSTRLRALAATAGAKGNSPDLDLATRLTKAAEVHEAPVPRMQRGE